MPLEKRPLPPCFFAELRSRPTLLDKVIMAVGGKKAFAKAIGRHDCCITRYASKHREYQSVGLSGGIPEYVVEKLEEHTHGWVQWEDWRADGWTTEQSRMLYLLKKNKQLEKKGDGVVKTRKRAK